MTLGINYHPLFSRVRGGLDKIEMKPILILLTLDWNWAGQKNVSIANFYPKNSPLGPQKNKDNPKSRSKLKVKIEVGIENKSLGSIKVDPKTASEPYPKNSPLGPQK